MTPRSIYYKEDHSCQYSFSLPEEMTEGMKLGMIDMLGGTSDEAVSEVIEHGHGVTKDGHIQDMIYFKCTFGGMMDMKGYASTVHDMEAKYSEVKFFMMEEGEWDDLALQIHEKGLKLMYPLH